MERKIIFFLSITKQYLFDQYLFFSTLEIKAHKMYVAAVQFKDLTGSKPFLDVKTIFVRQVSEIRVIGENKKFQKFNPKDCEDFERQKCYAAKLSCGENCNIQENYANHKCDGWYTCVILNIAGMKSIIGTIERISHF